MNELQRIMRVLNLPPDAKVVAARVDIEAGAPTYVDVRFVLHADEVDALLADEPPDFGRDPIASVRCWQGRHEECGGFATTPVIDNPRTPIVPCECHCHQAKRIKLSN